MGGTILNVAPGAVGSILGIVIGNRLSTRVRESIVTALGLITLFFGIQNAFQTGNPIVTLLSVVIGVLVGEWLRIDVGLEALGGWFHRRLGGEGESIGENGEPREDSGRRRFVNGFVTASLVFCIGPLTFLGALYDGMGLPAGFRMLAVKSTLDGFAALAFAASFGLGVAASIVTIFVLQGGLALAGSVAGEVMSEAMLNETTAVGGVLLMGLSLVLLDLKRPRVANFLPALVVAPAIVALAAVLGIDIYPSL
ncbi:MAG: DUF554 domain-containing protein [Spirochaetales bacterium]|nr:DUF554 domain-containing protein [Spirochaetales bacterium]